MVSSTPLTTYLMTTSTPIMTVSTNAVINWTLIISISVVGTVILIVVAVLTLTLLVLFIRRKIHRNEEHKDNIVNDIPMDDNVAYHHVVDNDHIVDNVAYHVVVEATNVTSTIEEYDYI